MLMFLRSNEMKCFCLIFFIFSIFSGFIFLCNTEEKAMEITNQSYGYSVNNINDAKTMLSYFSVDKPLGKVIETKMDNDMDLNKYHYAIPFMFVIGQDKEDKNLLDVKVNVLYMEKDGIVHSTTGKMKITNKLLSDFRQKLKEFPKQCPDLFNNDFYDHYLIYDTDLAKEENSNVSINLEHSLEHKINSIDFNNILKDNVKRADIYSKLKYPGFSKYSNVKSDGSLENVVINHEKEVVVKIDPVSSKNDIVLSNVITVTDDKDGIIPETSVHEHLWMIPSNDYRELREKTNYIQKNDAFSQIVTQPKDLVEFSK